MKAMISLAETNKDIILITGSNNNNHYCAY